MPEALSLLVVDDDAADRRAVQRALRTLRPEWALQELASAADVVSILERQATHCVLLDLNLPGEDGLSLLRRVRLAKIDVPVVIMTGQKDTEIAVEAMKTGAVDFISKHGLEPERLVQSVVRAVRLAKAERQAREAQEALRLQEAEYRRLVELLPDVVARFDREHRHLFVSGSIERYTGLKPDQIIGRTNAELGMPGGLEAEWSRHIDEAFTGLEVTFDFTWGDDAARRHFTARLVPEPSAPGLVTSVLGVVRDETERREAEQSAAKRAEFEQQLIGIVSHDLRNPLGAISMAAGLLMASGELTGRGLTVVNRIISSTRRATRMIEDLLDFTRARVGGGIAVRTRDADLHDVGRRAVDEATTATPGRIIALETQGDGGGRWDVERLEQVASNLITNALKSHD